MPILTPQLNNLPSWPWPGQHDQFDIHYNNCPIGSYYDPFCDTIVTVYFGQMGERKIYLSHPSLGVPLIQDTSIGQGLIFGGQAFPSPVPPSPLQPQVEEEMPAMDKDEIQKRLRRARRGYDLYRDRDAEETDCFDFPTYAKLFHGVTLAQAKKYWKNGDI